MYGFYDPTDPAQDSYTPPFNPKFLSFIAQQRVAAHARHLLMRFKAYRQARDPNRRFYTQYLRDLPEG